MNRSQLQSNNCSKISATYNIRVHVDFACRKFSFQAPNPSRMYSENLEPLTPGRYGYYGLASKFKLQNNSSKKLQNNSFLYRDSERVQHCQCHIIMTMFVVKVLPHYTFVLLCFVSNILVAGTRLDPPEVLPGIHHWTVPVVLMNAPAAGSTSYPLLTCWTSSATETTPSW